MANNDFYFDLHIHPLIKSFNSGHPKPKVDIWEEIDHQKVSSKVAKIAEKSSVHVAKYSQCNFEKLLAGKNRAVSVSLTPVEFGFLDHRNLPKAISSSKGRKEVFSLISGMSYEKVSHIFNHVDYWEELNGEYNYLVKGQGKHKSGEYYLANNYKELNNIIKNENAIGIVLSIEGAHTLFDKEMLSGNMTQTALRKKLINHAGQMKSWDHPPFFITICHHFWNNLAGHARSITGPTSNILNQNKGLERGINGNGAIVIRELLSGDNGKRVLIDTKHFSVKARKEYYKFVKGYNRISTSDKIPIIQSHASPNGYKTMSGSVRKKDNKKKLKNGYLHNLGINISDEEFEIIGKSGGLVGLILNKERIYGDKFRAQVERLSDQEKIKEAYIKLVWDNLLQPVKVMKSKEAWDMMCIGSDWDGAITHLDGYDGADKMPQFRDDLYTYLDKYKYEKNHWHGYKAEELVEKIMKTNGMDFLKKHFV